jgi:putative ABC transport system permease protein
VQTIDEFVATSGGTIDSEVAGINLLMLLAILISFAGIANTLTLSVLERTKEIGLLRAVGMLPRQLRRMIRYEASLISLFGAVVGATIGVAFGAAAAVALPSTVTDTISIPVVQISAMMVLASVAGLVAAAVPAWRASRKNPLRLIAG